MRTYNYQTYGGLKDAIKFELTSVIGRTFLKNRSRVPITRDPILLDLGFGQNRTKGWLNADFYQIHYRFWRKLSKESYKPDVELDLRYPLNCPSNAVDGIYSCHTLEHLYPDDAISLLKECLRILKPSCYLRMLVPDLGNAVKYYLGENKDFEFETGCEAISDMTQNWGHKSAWDECYLSKILGEIGFTNIRKVEFGKEGSDRRLIKEEEVRRKGTLAMEAQKPAG